MSEKANPARPVRPNVSSGFWLAGWLFTIFFARLVWWKALLAIVAWPYFLALAAR